MTDDTNPLANGGRDYAAWVEKLDDEALSILETMLREDMAFGHGVTAEDHKCFENNRFRHNTVLAEIGYRARDKKKKEATLQRALPDPEDKP